MNIYQPKSQSGMVLLLCLMFLTALTILGLSASADTILQNQLAGNLQQTELAKQNARVALRWAEQWLKNTQGPAPGICTATCSGFTVHPLRSFQSQPEFADHTWWQSHGFEAGIDPLTGNRLANLSTRSLQPPLWIIEVAHDLPAEGDTADPDLVWYRLLARGSSETGTAISVVESIVAKSWSDDTEFARKNSGRTSWRELR